MRNVLFGSIFTLAFLEGSQSAAQDSNQVQVIEEITVTGTKQNTSLQDADVAVTVLNEQALFDARVADIGRIDDLVPNVQFKVLRRRV